MHKSEDEAVRNNTSKFWSEDRANSVQKSNLVSNKVLVCYRLFAFMLGVSIVVANSYQRQWRFFDSLYTLTHWGCMASNIYFGLTLIHTVLYSSSTKSTDNVLGKVIHILGEVVFSLEIPINIGYWLVILPYTLYHFPSYQQPAIRTVVTTLQHIGFLILIIIEFSLNTLQFMQNHAYVPVSIMGIYMIFNFVLTRVGLQIYPGIDWMNGLSLVFLAGGLAFTSLGFSFARQIKALTI